MKNRNRNRNVKGKQYSVLLLSSLNWRCRQRRCWRGVLQSLVGLFGDSFSTKKSRVSMLLRHTNLVQFCGSKKQTLSRFQPDPNVSSLDPYWHSPILRDTNRLFHLKSLHGYHQTTWASSSPFLGQFIERTPVWIPFSETPSWQNHSKTTTAKRTE